MKANELRIGNIIKWDDESQDFVTVIGIDTKDNSTAIATNQNELAEIEEFEPIFLTKDWLERFGFTESNQLFVYKGDNFQVFIYPNISDDYFHFSANQWLIVNVWYVHQLQNLIYTLFGVELQLSST